jgi:hypothetical protein
LTDAELEAMADAIYTRLWENSQFREVTEAVVCRLIAEAVRAWEQAPTAVQLPAVPEATNDPANEPTNEPAG